MICYFVALTAGSSPLVRGAQLSVFLPVPMVGIIPARAGSTFRHDAGGLRAQDHPRSCGEHDPLVRAKSGLLGSSPLVRGALVSRDLVFVVGGIIPARAGSTPAQAASVRRRRDHPRSCGEHHPEQHQGQHGEGSSPLVRGALGRSSRYWPVPGIIPARAGSTFSSRTGACRARDHPRSCGEHLLLCVVGTIIAGSSPLVRGALPRSMPSAGWCRIIPARAGSTSCTSRQRGAR